jgi:hypothetical protein
MNLRSIVASALFLGAATLPGTASANDPTYWPWINGQIVFMPKYTNAQGGVFVDCHDITVTASDASGVQLGGWSTSAKAFDPGVLTQSSTTPCMYNLQIPDAGNRATPHIQISVTKAACPYGVNVAMLTRPVIGPIRLPRDTKAEIGAFVIQSAACNPKPAAPPVAR